MEEDNVAIRLKGLIQALGVTNSQFADKCGIPRPSLSQLLGGRNKKISDIIVGQIHQAYPEVNILWLLFGEGAMMNRANECVQNANPQNQDNNLNFAQQDNLELQPGTINFQSGSLIDERGYESSAKIGQDGVMEANLFGHTGEIPGGRSNLQNYGNVRPLNKGNAGYNSSAKQAVDTDARVVGLLKQIDQMKKNPRKVSSITIYYDDSTFETFYPR